MKLVLSFEMNRYAKKITPPEHGSNGKYIFLSKKPGIIKYVIGQPLIIFSS